MPDQPIWYRLIPEVLVTLENATVPYLDRAAVQELLGVGRRRAQQILKPLADTRLGGSLIVTTTHFAAHLRTIQCGQTRKSEARHPHKVDEIPASTQRLDSLPHWPELTASDHRGARLAALPSNIALRHGELRITFKDSLDLFQQLAALSLALIDDFAAVETFLSEGNK